MASDSIEGMGQLFTPGNNFTISIHTESEEEIHRLFNGLSAGGNVVMPLEKLFGLHCLACLTINFVFSGW